MANVVPSPTFGLQNFGQQDGSSPTDGMTPVWIASTDASLIFRGDIVVTSSNGGTNNSGAYITAPASGNSGPVRGVFQGCYQYQPGAGRVVWNNYYNGVVSGSTGDVKAYVIDNPDRNFIAFGSTTVAITSSYIGLNIGFTANSSTGNVTLGYSNISLQSTTVGSTQSLPLRIVDFYSAYALPAIPAIGAAAFINGTDNTNPGNIVVVRLNNCDRTNLTARSS